MLISDKTGGISICWKDFANDIEGDFDAKRSSQLQESVKHLKTKLPMEKVISKGQQHWRKPKKSPKTPELEWLLCLVRNVRNNLFHGGKYPMDVVRDPELLKSCIAVLNECRELNDTVNIEFEDYK